MEQQIVEELKQEISLLQAEIETLKAKKSIAECIRESFAQERPVRVLKRKVRHRAIGSKNPPQVEITILESDYEQLIEQAKSTAWVEQKLSELRNLGDRLWHKMNHSTVLQDAIRRAESAEISCRALRQEVEQLKSQPVQEYEVYEEVYIDDDEGREIDYPSFDDREP